LGFSAAIASIVVIHTLRCSGVVSAVHGKTPAYTISPLITADSDGMTT